MAADGHHHQFIIVYRHAFKLRNIEMRFSAAGVKTAVTVAIREIEPTGYPYPLVIIFKTRNGEFNAVPDGIIVLQVLFPINFTTTSECSFRQPAYNNRL